MEIKSFRSLLEAAKAIRSGDIQGLNPGFVEHFYNRSCIYFLINSQAENESNVVYVGQTKSLGNRIGAHYGEKTKVFDSFNYFYINDDLLDEMEEMLICIYRPKYNEKGYNWFTKKFSEVVDMSVPSLNKIHSISAIQPSLDTVIGILENNGSMVRWLANNKKP